jgi:hypothetical protein
MAFGPDGKILVAGCSGLIVLWDVARRQRLVRLCHLGCSAV